MVHLYIPTTISYLIWSTSIPNHYLLFDMIHLYLPTTISYPIWSTFISQPLSPIGYGPPLSPNHYLLSDMVQLYLPTRVQNRRSLLAKCECERLRSSTQVSTLARNIEYQKAKRHRVLLALRSIYSTVMMSYDVEKLCGYIVYYLVQRVIKQRN